MRKYVRLQNASKVHFTYLTTLQLIFIQLGPDDLFAPMRDRAKVLRVPHYDRNDLPAWLLILIIPNRERATAAATHSSEGAAATAPENPREIPELPP